MAEVTIQATHERQTSKGPLWEVSFSDGVTALTMLPELGNLATSSRGKSAIRETVVRPSRSPNFPASIWLNNLQIVNQNVPEEQDKLNTDAMLARVADSTNSAIYKLTPDRLTPDIDLRLSVLRLAVEFSASLQNTEGSPASVTSYADIFEQYVRNGYSEIPY